MRMLKTSLLAVVVLSSGCGVDVGELQPGPDEYGTTSQELGTDNGLSENGFSKNGFSKNGLSQNGFSQNGLTINGFSKNGLSKNGFSKNGLLADGGLTLMAAATTLPDDNFIKAFNLAPADTAAFLKYFTKCAAPASTVLKLGLDTGTQTVTTGTSVVSSTVASVLNPTTGVIALSKGASGVTCTTTTTSVVGTVTTTTVRPCKYQFPGSFGFAPTWVGNGAMSVDEQEMVSACLAAHVNLTGNNVAFSLRVGKYASVTMPAYPNPGTYLVAPAPVTSGILGAAQALVPSTAAERTSYPQNEAAFWGNLFDATAPAIYACKGSWTTTINGITQDYGYPAFGNNTATYPLTPGRGQGSIASNKLTSKLGGVGVVNLPLCKNVCAPVVNEGGQLTWSLCQTSDAHSSLPSSAYWNIWAGTCPLMPFSLMTSAGYNWMVVGADATGKQSCTGPWSQWAFPYPKAKNVVTTYLPPITGTLPFCSPRGTVATMAASCCSLALDATGKCL